MESGAHARHARPPDDRRLRPLARGRRLLRAGEGLSDLGDPMPDLGGIEHHALDQRLRPDRARPGRHAAVLVDRRGIDGFRPGTV